ncbi:MAG: aminotransferase class I/II-fold pyridoxal phosphate-dependent enzyme [Pseudomonadota bacterium]
MGESALTDGQSLIEDLRASHKRRAQVREERARDGSRPPAVQDISKLPEAEVHRAMETAAGALGLSSPFFRVHEGAPGARQIVEGEECINFASYNYLGLNTAPEVLAASATMLEAVGLSPGASRLVGGEQAVQRRLETRLAEIYGVEDAVAMVSGHATNVTTLGTLLGPQDLILTDQFAHNSIVEGARLSGATRVVFPHNDLDWLERHLTLTRGQHRRALIAVEGLYSMDGDMPDLKRLIDIKDRHAAWLMVDEAHALGVLGDTGRGSAEAQGVDPAQVEIWMGTLSKTLGACGGYIAGSRDLIRLLKFGASGFVFSVGLSPVLAAGADAALSMMMREPDRVRRLQHNGSLFRNALRAAEVDTGLSEGFSVIPVVTGDSVRAVTLSSELLSRGINALPIIYPAVPEKAARVRFFVTSEHREADLIEAAKQTASVLAEINLGARKSQERIREVAQKLQAGSSGSISDLNP